MSVSSKVSPRILTPAMRLPLVAKVKEPAWLVAAGAHTLLCSWSENATLLPTPPAPNAKTKRSSLTTIAVVLVGALDKSAAGVPVLFAHW